MIRRRSKSDTDKDFAGSPEGGTSGVLKFAIDDPGIAPAEPVRVRVRWAQE